MTVEPRLGGEAVYHVTQVREEQSRQMPQLVSDFKGEVFLECSENNRKASGIWETCSKTCSKVKQVRVVNCKPF